MCVCKGCLCASSPFQCAFLFFFFKRWFLKTAHVLEVRLGIPIPVFGFDPKTRQLNLTQSCGLYHKAAILMRSGQCINRTFVRRCHSRRSSAAAENLGAAVHCSQRRIFNLPSDVIVVAGEKRGAGNAGVRHRYSTGRKMRRVPVIPLIVHSAPPLSPSPSPSPATIHQ